MNFYCFGLERKKKDVQMLCRKIQSLTKKYNLSGADEFEICFSLGWAVAVKGEKTLRQAVEEADVKMYREKKRRKR